MITQISKLQPGRVNFFAMVDTIRDKKNMQFIVVKDNSSKIQLFIDKVKYPEIGEMFLRLVPGATVRVEGELVLSEYVKMGGKEVLVDAAEVTSYAEPNPIAEDSTIDYKINYRWIDLRTDKNALLFKVQTTFVNAMRECEGGAPRLHYDRIEGMNHSRPARIFYMTECYEWLFKHSLSDEGRPVAPKYEISESTLNSRNVYRGTSTRKREGLIREPEE